jgi:hypothetical protein
MLGVVGVELPAMMTARGAQVDLSTIPWTQLPSLDAWVLRFENLDSETVMGGEMMIDIQLQRNPVDELKRTGLLDENGFPTTKTRREQHRS